MKIKELLQKIPTTNIYFKLISVFLIFYIIVFLNIENMERSITFP
jgi:hypothetical protein